MRRLIVLASLVLAACAPETGEPAQQREPLPPPDTERLATIFDPVYEPMGLRLVQGNLHDADDYAISPGGTHLALYLEPAGEEEWTPERYAEAVMPTLRPLSPEVFERWTALESFDLCLALPGTEPGGTPEAVTQIVVNREAILELDWDRATLAEMLSASEATDAIEVRAFGEITQTEEWTEAERAAGGQAR
jgi:hypothetical protein